MISGNSSSKKSTVNLTAKFEKLDAFDRTTSDYEELNYAAKSNKILLQYVYTFAFANPEPIKNIKVFRSVQNKNQIVISGSKKTQKIQYSHQ